MPHEGSAQVTASASRRPAVDGLGHAPTELGRVTPRVVIRLPDLRAPQKPSLWLRWAGFALALVGGSGLGAAGKLAASKRGKSSPTDDPSDLTDPANVAHYWAIYQRLRPLVQYIFTHPKTIVSGALAAAAQFVALVAWHESGRSPNNTAMVDAPCQTTTDQAPPAWHPAYRYQVDRRGNGDPTHHPNRNEGQGPWILDPHTHLGPGSGDRRHYRGGERSNSDHEHLPHAALNRPSRLSQSEPTDDQQPAGPMTGEDSEPVMARVALRPDSRREPLGQGRLPGVAQLEGNIIQSPPREASHEPAQSSVH